MIAWRISQIETSTVGTNDHGKSRALARFTRQCHIAPIMRAGLRVNNFACCSGVMPMPVAR